jgi:NADPH:quinone reductase-like Zn-dependent oxidoreductase
MKAAVIERLGQAPRYGDADEPTATDGAIGQVLAAAVKNIDRALVAGKHYGSGQLKLPGVAGIDAVVRLADDRRVYTGATPPAGSMAERLVVNPALCVDIPDQVSDADAAALPNAAVSAWFALEYAGRIQPGQNVLVLGATGITGALAVQLAKQKFGADRVVAVGRNAARLDQLLDNGADTVVRIGDAPERLGTEVARLHAERPFDLVVDHLWGPPAEQTLRALAGSDLSAEFHRTRFVQIGSMAGPDITLPAAVLRSAGVELVGQGAGSMPQDSAARISTEILPTLYAMLAAGSISISTVTRPLADVTAAWDEKLPSGVRLVLVP